MVAVSMDLWSVVFFAGKGGEEPSAAGTEFLKICMPKDAADAICTFRFYRSNLTHDIYRGSYAMEGRVFGLCGIPESW